MNLDKSVFTKFQDAVLNIKNILSEDKKHPLLLACIYNISIGACFKGKEYSEIIEIADKFHQLVVFPEKLRLFNDGSIDYYREWKIDILDSTMQLCMNVVYEIDIDPLSPESYKEELNDIVNILQSDFSSIQPKCDMRDLVNDIIERLGYFDLLYNFYMANHQNYCDIMHAGMKFPPLPYMSFVDGICYLFDEFKEHLPSYIEPIRNINVIDYIKEIYNLNDSLQKSLNESLQNLNNGKLEDCIINLNDVRHYWIKLKEIIS